MHTVRKPPSEVVIELLADHPEDTAPLARHFYAQWPKWSGSVAAQMELFESRSNRDRIPIALVAHGAGALLGTVSLLERSVHSHSHLVPWVAGLYVLPEARHAGVGMRLVAGVESWAARLGFGALYIGVATAQEQYEQRGWHRLGIGRAGEDTVSVLSKSLTAVS